jgi:arylsulfatase A-like enzyme
LADSLKSSWIDPEAFPLAEFQSRARLTEAQLAETVAAPLSERTTWSSLKTFYAVDRPHLAVALDRWRSAEPRLLMLVLRGPDPVQHYAWDTVEPWRYATQREHLDRDRGVVEGVYRYVDTFLAEAMAACDENTTLIVLSDHGAEPSLDAADPKRTGRPGAHTRKAKGVLFLYGPKVKSGARIVKAGPLDIAPTVAWLLGLPVAEDLTGRVLAEAFQRDFTARRGLTTVPTWGMREPSAEASPFPTTTYFSTVFRSGATLASNGTSVSSTMMTLSSAWLMT